LELHATECNVANLVSASLNSATQALALWRDLGDAAAQARVPLQMGRQYWKSGQKAFADRHVAEAIALLETLPQSRGLAMAYSARSQLAMTSDHLDEALEFGQRALDLAIRFEDHSVRAHALNNIGTALSESGFVAGFEKLKESLTVALEHNLQDDAGRAYANIVSTSARQRLSALALRYLPKASTTVKYTTSRTRSHTFGCMAHSSSSTTANGRRPHASPRS